MLDETFLLRDGGGVGRRCEGCTLCQVQSDGGSWRTRHLRLHTWKLRGFEDDVALRARKHAMDASRAISSDKWDETLWASDGWMVRSPGRLRKQAFPSNPSLYND